MYLVLMTGFSRPDLPRRSREAGFDRYVIKPFGLDCVRELVATYIASSASPSGSGSSSGAVSGRLERSA
jgi:hypothetical protein